MTTTGQIIARAAAVPIIAAAATACTGGASTAQTTEAGCGARPAPPGPIVVRSYEPGQPPTALQLADRWLWIPPAGGCVTSVTWLLAGAPRTSGCMQVGLMAGNPGYPAAVVPAPPLREVLEQEGPAC